MGATITAAIQTATANSSGQAAREPEVSAATASLRYSTDDLEGALSLHFERLGPILSPISPQNVGNEKSLGYGCPLAEHMQSQARRLQSLTAYIRDITSRLEI